MTGHGSLLIREDPLIVLPALATAIGLNEAIALQQLYFRGLKYADAEGWVQKTAAEWNRDFPFWSTKTIRRTWSSLREQGLVETGIVRLEGGGREGKIRILFEAVEALERCGQDGQTGVDSKGRPVGTTCPDSLRTGGSAGAAPAAKAAGAAPSGPAHRRTSPTASGTSRRRSASDDERGEWRPAVVRLVELFADGMLANDPKAKVSPSSRAWLDPIRLLLDRDDRTADEVEAVIRWVHRDTFERTVVLSPGKLRERFTGLRMKAGLSGAGSLVVPVAPTSGAASAPRGTDAARALRELADAERAGGPVIDGRETGT